MPRAPHGADTSPRPPADSCKWPCRSPTAARQIYSASAKSILNIDTAARAHRQQVHRMRLCASGSITVAAPLTIRAKAPLPSPRCNCVSQVQPPPGVGCPGHHRLCKAMHIRKSTGCNCTHRRCRCISRNPPMSIKISNRKAIPRAGTTRSNSSCRPRLRRTQRDQFIPLRRASLSEPSPLRAAGDTNKNNARYSSEVAISTSRSSSSSSKSTSGAG